MRCANCGKGVFSDVMVCPFCRQPFTATRGDSGRALAPVSSDMAKFKIKIARWHLYVAGAVVVAALTSFFVFSTTSSLIEPIQRQLNAFKRSDLQAAYAETSTGFQQEISFERFAELMGSVPSLSHNVSHSFPSRSSSTSISDGTGTGDVQGSITDDQGTVQSVHYELVKEHGVWKIKGMHFGRRIAGR